MFGLMILKPSVIVLPLSPKNHESKEYVKYALFENDQLDQAEDLFLWLWEKPKLVGYNNLHFDGQVVEWMWRTKEVNGRKIYEFAQSVIDTKDKFQLPYKPWGFTHKQLDLMAISNYGIYGKPYFTEMARIYYTSTINTRLTI
jgi:hypothetical protein